MKQTIEIEVPDGKRAVWKDDKVVFEDIKPKLPRTWQEFCYSNDRKPNEAFISNGSEINCVTEQHERKFYQDRNLLPSKQAAEQHLALMQLHQLRDCYRNDWKPDCKDYNEYVIFKNRDNKYDVLTNCWGIRFLTFQTEERAKEFLNNFRELIEEAGDLI